MGNATLLHIVASSDPKCYIMSTEGGYVALLANRKQRNVTL